MGGRVQEGRPQVWCTSHSCTSCCVHLGVLAPGIRVARISFCSAGVACFCTEEGVFASRCALPVMVPCAHAASSRGTSKRRGPSSALRAFGDALALITRGQGLP